MQEFRKGPSLCRHSLSQFKAQRSFSKGKFSDTKLSKKKEKVSTTGESSVRSPRYWGKENNFEIISRETPIDFTLGNDERLTDGDSRREIPTCPEFSAKFQNFSSKATLREKNSYLFTYNNVSKPFPNLVLKSPLTGYCVCNKKSDYLMSPADSESDVSQLITNDI